MGVSIIDVLRVGLASVGDEIDFFPFFFSVGYCGCYRSTGKVRVRKQRGNECITERESFVNERLIESRVKILDNATCNNAIAKLKLRIA